MPHINWHALPRAVREHLQDRARTRLLSKEDLLNLMEWVRNNPEVPEGARCKDFGTFKLVGHGAIPSTFLEQPALAPLFERVTRARHLRIDRSMEPPPYSDTAFWSISWRSAAMNSPSPCAP